MRNAQSTPAGTLRAHHRDRETTISMGGLQFDVVRTSSLPVRERERESEKDRDREREIEIERERDREREIERDRER